MSPGRTPAEEAAYHAGVVDARLEALEAHAVTVNGTVKATGDALNALSSNVNALNLTIKMLDLSGLRARVRTLEDNAKVGVGIEQFKRWLLGAVVTIVVAFTAVIELVIHLSH